MASRSEPPWPSVTVNVTPEYRPAWVNPGVQVNVRVGGSNVAPDGTFEAEYVSVSPGSESVALTWNVRVAPSATVRSPMAARTGGWFVAAPGQNPPATAYGPPVRGADASGWPMVAPRPYVPPVPDVIPPPSTVCQEISYGPLVCAAPGMGARSTAAASRARMAGIPPSCALIPPGCAFSYIGPP